MPDSPAHCVICGAGLPKCSGAGRPRLYCSTACRRVAEYEIRRIALRLEGVDQALSSIRIHRERAGETLVFPTIEAALAAYEAERALLTERLRLLASGQPGAPPAFTEED